MDPWIAFDQARARWELEWHRRVRVRDQRWSAKQDLVTHLLVFAIINPTLWLLWGTSGTGVLWPMLFTAPWSAWLAISALRYRSLPREDAETVAPTPSTVPAGDRA